MYRSWCVSKKRQGIWRVLRRTLADSLIIVLAYAIAVGCFGPTHTPYSRQAWLLVGVVTICAYLALNATLKFYSRLWGHGGVEEPLSILISVELATLTLILTHLVLSPFSVTFAPLAIILTGGNLTFIGFLGIRYRHLIRRRLGQLKDHRTSLKQSRVLIVGTTSEAQQLARRLSQDTLRRYQIVGFIDNDPTRLHMAVESWRVLGAVEDIFRITHAEQVDVIVITEHKANVCELNELVNLCQQTPAQVKILPNGLEVLNNQRWDLRSLRDVTVDDLLSREPVEIDKTLCREVIANRVVLVTGASGSIGSELCRQISSFAPARMLLLDNNESALHDLMVELESEPNQPPLRMILGDITHAAKMERLFKNEEPQLVFHAAAYKHVPMLEAHPEEAVRVNVSGTMILSEYAARYGVERFVFISTDKAVNPSSVMGASKRIGEIWLSALDRIAAHTIYTIVRFGNVIGSRGSVVPIFTRQIEWGGPLTVTHPEMTRFFMSIPEAVSLVLHAMTLSQAGDIYMLDMGEQVSILGLAQRMIRLRGLRVDSDIQIKYTGIRPGEKLHEELSYCDELHTLTSHSRIYRLHNQQTLPDLKALLGYTAVLIEAAQHPEINGRLRPAMLTAAQGDLDKSLNLLADIDSPERHRRPVSPMIQSKKERPSKQEFAPSLGRSTNLEFQPAN
jgi:FlaA1/EpsC-like NDP-sugar epimerase